ncbi:MAG: NAD kinase [Rhizobiaceae bacterium]|nr:NAD kinase [Rhizobiaceae bacterium]
MKKKIAFVASDADEAQAAHEKLVSIYGNNLPSEADILVALGGDGFMLQTQHDFMNSGIPIYGMNKGTVGFLMNEYRTDNLHQRLATAVRSKIRPLVMRATDMDGQIHEAHAINEVSLLRQSYQAASLKITTDRKLRMEALVCDGVLVATPAGSTAYNLSAHGPILPLSAPLLALTPVSPFRPRRWRGALLPNTSEVLIEVNEPKKRPVNAVADHTEVKSVREVRIALDMDQVGTILFDADHSWDDRILAEQFQY